jgi:hypothetical protein
MASMEVHQKCTRKDRDTLAGTPGICANMFMRRMSRWVFLVAAMAAAARAQHYAIQSVPGAPHGIFTMMQDGHSALWMGTIDDVVRFEGEHFYSPRPYGFPKETPNNFSEDSDGAIWIATDAQFLAMEFVHGESLRDRLEQGALPRKQIAAFLLQIAGALQLLHRSMIYRRDLKPENLMIRINDGRDQQIVFIDFSIAIVKSPDQTFHGI